jgi:hypothetical protein
MISEGLRDGAAGVKTNGGAAAYLHIAGSQKQGKFF